MGIYCGTSHFILITISIHQQSQANFNKKMKSINKPSNYQFLARYWQLKNMVISFGRNAGHVPTECSDL